MYTAPDGKQYRPSMFITLTCDSYGKVNNDGTPADPASYDYTRAAPDAIHFAALFDRFIQNLRGCWAMRRNTSAAWNRRNASPRTCTWRSGAACRGHCCARSWPRCRRLV